MIEKATAAEYAVDVMLCGPAAAAAVELVNELSPLLILLRCQAIGPACKLQQCLDWYRSQAPVSGHQEDTTTTMCVICIPVIIESFIFI